MNQHYNQLGKIFLREMQGQGPGEQRRRPRQTGPGYRPQRGAQAPRRVVTGNPPPKLTRAQLNVLGELAARRGRKDEKK